MRAHYNGFWLLAVSLVIVGITSAAEAQSKRRGYVSGTYELRPGEMSLGGGTFWSQSGLLSGDAIYDDQDPNHSSSSGTKVQVALHDGTSKKGLSIETGSRANFLTLYDGKSHSLLWVPFEAINSITAKTVSSQTVAGVRRDAEVFERFWIEQDAREKKDLKVRLIIDLLYALPSIQRAVEGLLWESTPSIRLFKDGKWEVIQWDSISSLTIQQRDTSPNKPSDPVEPPLFCYRYQGDYANVWREYSVKKAEEKKSADTKSK